MGGFNEEKKGQVSHERDFIRSAENRLTASRMVGGRKERTQDCMLG